MESLNNRSASGKKESCAVHEEPEEALSIAKSIIQGNSRNKYGVQTISSLAPYMQAHSTSENQLIFGYLPNCTVINVVPVPTVHFIFHVDLETS